MTDCITNDTLSERPVFKPMEKLFFLFFYPFFCFAISDAEYEKQLHNIYLKHYKEPISYTDWNSQIQDLPKKHKLKNKDNMWDLSQSFFKNPLYWSKMWVVNPQVENPHQIYSGDFIKLDPVSLSKAPQSEFSADLEELFPELIVPQTSSRKALKEIEFPSSLPQLNLLTKESIISAEIDFSSLNFSKPKKTAPAAFYLSDSTPSKQAEFVSQESYGKIFGVTGEQLILRLNQTAPVGTYFTVFKKLNSKFRLFSIRGSEHEIQVKGILKISSYIQGSGSLYKAQVISALSPLDIKDSIFKGLPPSYSFSSQKTGSGQGLIIGSPYKNRLFLTAGSLVYLNKGQADGIYKNDSFYIQPEKTENSKFFKRPYKYESIGRLKVIALSQNKATAVILSAKDSIYIGDSFTGLIKATDVETIDNQELELMEEFEEVEDFQDNPPDLFEDLDKKEDEELIEEFENPETENRLGEDFEIETEVSPREKSLEENQQDQELEEEFQFFIEEKEMDESLNEEKVEAEKIKKEMEDMEGFEEEWPEEELMEENEPIEESELIEEDFEEMEAEPTEENNDLEDFEEIDMF